MPQANSISINAKPLYLITTADERTWKFDRPVLFLGEWCRRYDRHHLWVMMDAVVAEPYGLGKDQKDRDYDYVEKLFAGLLVELAGALNHHHGTSHSLRYWRILLGHWLHRYTSVIFNRFFTLEQAVSQHKITGVTVFGEGSFSLVTPDSLTFIWACSEDVWNNVLYAKILKFIPIGDFQTESLDFGSVDGFGLSGALPQFMVRSWLKRLVLKGVEIVLPLCGRRQDAFVINSYLPFKEEIKLQLSLGQIPQFWRSPKPVSVELDRQLRERLSLNIAGHQGFEQCVRALLFDLLPICYLEGYPALQDQVRRLPWPEEPKFIFTSNNFDTDEVFKAWTGERVSQGVPYYTGEHGTNYGTHRYVHSETECVETSDKFLTWGWIDGNSKHVPVFIFSCAGQKKQEPKNTGGLLLIEVHCPLRLEAWDEYPEFQIYQEEQFRFVENLPTLIQQELTVRLYGGYKRLSWCEEQRWCDRCPTIKLDDATHNIRKLISNSRLIIHTYNSTGILETLSQNIPTLIFWEGGLAYMRESAKPYYEELQQAGILFNSAESAAKKVAEVWGDVPAWWNSGEVQSAREMFCDRYARVSSNPISEFKKILLSHK